MSKEENLNHLPKIKNTERKNYPDLKTETELKKMKLMPTGEPVAYGLQQLIEMLFNTIKKQKQIPYQFDFEMHLARFGLLVGVIACKMFI